MQRVFCILFFFKLVVFFFLGLEGWVNLFIELLKSFGSLFFDNFNYFFGKFLEGFRSFIVWFKFKYVFIFILGFFQGYGFWYCGQYWSVWIGFFQFFEVYFWDFCLFGKFIGNEVEEFEVFVGFFFDYFYQVEYELYVDYFEVVKFEWYQNVV